jgi:hypothetical protein
MQSLALLLLLGVVVSSTLSFNTFVFAEDAPADQDATADEETTPEETTDDVADDAMEDTSEEDVMEDTSDDTMEEDVTEEDTAQDPDEYLASPLQQLKSGTDPHEIQCNTGLKLVFKATNYHPACIKESSYEVLLQRGWVSEHNPSHEDLMGMMEDMSTDETTDDTAKDTMEEDTTDDGVKLDEQVDVEEESTSENGTNPTPQNYTIDLSESMDMSAN